MMKNSAQIGEKQTSEHKSDPRVKAPTLGFCAFLQLWITCLPAGHAKTLYLHLWNRISPSASFQNVEILKIFAFLGNSAETLQRSPLSTGFIYRKGL